MTSSKWLLPISTRIGQEIKLAICSVLTRLSYASVQRIRCETCTFSILGWVFVFPLLKTLRIDRPALVLAASTSSEVCLNYSSDKKLLDDRQHISQDLKTSIATRDESMGQKPTQQSKVSEVGLTFDSRERPKLARQTLARGSSRLLLD